jgi:hypothetical protein
MNFALNRLGSGVPARPILLLSMQRAFRRAPAGRHGPCYAKETVRMLEKIGNFLGHSGR